MADWNIFEPPAPPSATVRRSFTECPSDTINLADATGLRSATGGVITCKTRNNSRWYDLHDSYLEVRFVVAIPGTGIAPASIATLGINAGWGIFDRVEVVVGAGNAVDTTDKNLAAIHHTYALSRYSADQLQTAASNEWVYVEKAREVFSGPTTQMDSDAIANWEERYEYRKILGAAAFVDPTAHTLSDASLLRSKRYNKVFDRKLMRTGSNDAVNGSKEVTLMLPLKAISGFVDQLRVPLRGIPLELKLTRNTSWRQLIHAASGVGGNFEVIIRSVSWWLPEVEPDAETEARVNQALYSNQMISYKFENRTGFVSGEYGPAPTTGLNIDYRLESLAARPSLIYVMFQHSRQFNDYTDAEAPTVDITMPAAGVLTWSQFGIANPGIYSPIGNIQRLELRANSKRYPDEAYELNTMDTSVALTQDGAMRAYRDFIAATYKDRGEFSNIIDFATWSCSPVFAFKLDTDEDLFDKVKTVDLRIMATITSTNNVADAINPGTFRVLAVVYSDRDLQMRFIDGASIMTT
jgi:hypothetical protein